MKILEKEGFANPDALSQIGIGVRSDGTVSLGSNVSCDGRVNDSNEAIIFSHAHEDHVTNSAIADAYSKNKKVIMTEDTRKLCASTMLCNLDWNFHLEIVEQGKVTEYQNFNVCLEESNHILGSAQILVDDKKYGRLGYSGDIGENINEFIDAEVLVLDSTYSGEATNRKWSMDYCMEELVADIKSNMVRDTINIIADPGLLLVSYTHLTLPTILLV